MKSVPGMVAGSTQTPSTRVAPMKSAEHSSWIGGGFLAASAGLAAAMPSSSDPAAHHDGHGPSHRGQPPLAA
jgi:hypothetical protein